MHLFSRRDVLAKSGGLAALLASGILNESADAAQDQQPQDANNNRNANERLNIAVIGVNGQGRGHVGGYAGRHNCVVSHICDVDSAVIGPAMQSAARAQGFEPQHVQDLRRIMDNRDIHAVSIATPNRLMSSGLTVSVSSSSGSVGSGVTAPSATVPASSSDPAPSRFSRLSRPAGPPGSARLARP